MLDRRQLLTRAAGAGVCLGCGASDALGQARARNRRRKVVVGGHRVTTIDIHSHCVIPEITTILNGGPVEARARATLAFRGAQPTLEARLAHMDGQGVDIQVLSINPWWYAADRDLVRLVVDFQNEKLIGLCAEAPDRLRAFATVALQFPDLAAEQLETAVRRQGLCGAAIGCSVNADELSNRKYDPFWAKAEELQALIFMHPQQADTVTGISKRVEGYGALANVIGNPLETTIALSHMIMDGVFDRFPNLRVCAAHAGGYLPSYAGRLDRGCTVLYENCQGEGPKKKPSAYLKQIYVDSLVFTPEGMRHLAKESGARQIMIGTDYAFPWVEDPVGLVLETPGLSDADKIAILGGTAARLLKL